MLVSKIITQMSDAELHLVYDQLEKRLITLIKQHYNNHTKNSLTAEVLRAESELEMFESQCALVGRSLPAPSKFWETDISTLV